MSHALLASSAAERWINCPGSVNLTKDMPDTSSTYAKEGTLAHSICELKLRKYFGVLAPGEKKLMGPRKFKTELEKLKDNELYAPEMDGYTDEYLDYIKELANSFSSTPAVFCEQRIDMSEYADSCFGTADCILLCGTELHIIDFKYGKGVPVSAENNSQLNLYALGGYLMYKDFWNIESVHMHIVQPRLKSFERADLSLAELLMWAESVVKPAAKMALSENADIASGEWCRWCKAKATCREHASSVKKNVEDFNMMLPPLLSMEELGRLLVEVEPLLEYVKTAQDYAFNAALQGEKVPGWKLVEGRGSREWDNQEEAFKDIIASGVAEEMLYHREPYSLAQLEKQLGKKAFEEAVGSHVIKQQGKPKLALESDKRPEYIIKNADEDFKEIEIDG